MFSVGRDDRREDLTRFVSYYNNTAVIDLRLMRQACTIAYLSARTSRCLFSKTVKQFIAIQVDVPAVVRLVLESCLLYTISLRGKFRSVVMNIMSLAYSGGRETTSMTSPGGRILMRKIVRLVQQQLVVVLVLFLTVESRRVTGSRFCQRPALPGYGCSEHTVK